MADIEVYRVHDLGLTAARRAAEQMAADLGRKFDLRGKWQGNVLRFERPGVAGTLAITERDLHLSVSLGFLLKAMKSSVERSVMHEINTLFAPPGKGAEPPPADPPRPKRAAKRPRRGG
ncbi:MAG TPA: polyhydroxyalkanoic acid system family protein [Usitatibacter sp.]|nr:polyhydroxyalkanoic acid system family protein [Usitatibacter sp.]